jgi:hypothetical protein
MQGRSQTQIFTPSASTSTSSRNGHSNTSHTPLNFSNDSHHQRLNHSRSVTADHESTTSSRIHMYNLHQYNNDQGAPSHFKSRTVSETDMAFYASRIAELEESLRREVVARLVC